MYLFNWIKATLKRASQYSRSQTMFDIFKCIRRSLKLYIEELKQRIQKEDKTKSKDEQGFYSVVCFVINTSEYCKDTLDGLKENIA